MERDEYVWIFGSFYQITPGKRSNIVYCEINNVSLVSGYFWHIFDKSISNVLEIQRNEFIADNTNNEFNINIGSVEYIIHYNDDNNFLTTIKTDNDLDICVQENSNGRCRPILRIKWQDALQKLLIIGEHDSAFFKNIYCYKLNDQYCFFDTINQKKINDMKLNSYDDFINIDGTIYFINVKYDLMIDKEKKTMTSLCKYTKEKIGNY
jgi:hypothetical protein